MKLKDFNPIKIYNEYVKHENEENNRIREWDMENSQFTASSAGMCLKKHWYSANKYEGKEIKATDLRNMRLGTIFGNDIEKAMNWWQDEVIKDDKGGTIEVFTEGHLVSEKYNLSGHFDLLVVHSLDTNEPDPSFPGIKKQIKTGALFDWKTTHSHKFRKLFGRDPDISPSTNYEYQLGSYAMMINELNENNRYYCDEIAYMANVYYNKDTGVMKFKEAPLDYIEFAEKYWERVNKISKKGDPEPALGPWIPFYPEWECGKYCSYTDHCDSKYKTKGVKDNEKTRNINKVY